MKLFFSTLLFTLLVYTSAYSLTTTVSDGTKKILDVAMDSIDYMEEERIYFKPGVVQIVDSEIYLECTAGNFIAIPRVESSNGQLCITLSSPEVIVYECTRCKKTYYPKPPQRCSCGNTSFRAKIDVLP